MQFTPQHYFVLKLFSALGCGLVAGVFFAFSTFVMNALARLQPKEGMTAMQSINITAINPLFMGIFVGTAVTCIFIAGASLLNWYPSKSAYLLIGSLFYLVGAFGVTILFNVPLNEALAIADPDSANGASLWANYLANWTVWNHVRTISAILASAAITIALYE
ncbi:DUF1772 domain-containing protein [Pseudanabaena sp. UWO310]|uniref:anthrone oxygenase family protein n=1 Tax=Pseudanabaena sp. UWO310 TaxID=2480795 RepID=UPI001159F0A9|nr:DUF1772 domain-containing protein [Pseudanabaena sp. UWO310]